MKLKKKTIILCIFMLIILSKISTPIKIYLINEINFDPDGPDYNHENFSVKEISLNHLITNQSFNYKTNRKLNLTIKKRDDTLKKEVNKKNKIWFKKQNGTNLFNWYLVNSGDKLKLSYEEEIIREDENISYIIDINQTYEYFKTATEYVKTNYSKITFRMNNKTIINKTNYKNIIEIKIKKTNNTFENQTQNIDDRNNQENESSNNSSTFKKDCITFKWNSKNLQYSVIGYYLKNNCEKEINTNITYKIYNHLSNRIKKKNVSIKNKSENYYKLSQISNPIIAEIKIFNQTYKRSYFPLNQEETEKIDFEEEWINDNYRVKIDNKIFQDEEKEYRLWINCDEQKLSNYYNFKCSDCRFKTFISPYDYFYENKYQKCFLIKKDLLNNTVEKINLTNYEKDDENLKDNTEIEIDEEWDLGYYQINFEINSENTKKENYRLWINCDNEKLSNYYDFKCMLCDFKSEIKPYSRFYKKDYHFCKLILLNKKTDELSEIDLKNHQRDKNSIKNTLDIKSNDFWEKGLYKIKFEINSDSDIIKDYKIHLECDKEKLSNYYYFKCQKCEFESLIKPYEKFYSKNKKYTKCQLNVNSDSSLIKKIKLNNYVHNTKIEKDSLEIIDETLEKLMINFKIDLENQIKKNYRLWIECDKDKLSNYFDFTCNKCNFKSNIFLYERILNQDYKECFLKLEDGKENLKYNLNISKLKNKNTEEKDISLNRSNSLNNSIKKIPNESFIIERTIKNTEDTNKTEEINSTILRKNLDKNIGKDKRGVSKIVEIFEKFNFSFFFLQ